MKCFVIFSVLVAAALSSPSPVFIEPGSVTFETHDEFFEEYTRMREQRIASGTLGQKGQYNDLCYITVQFATKQQSCGCFIWNNFYVVTSARCVRDCSEGDPTSVFVTIASAAANSAVQKVNQIYIPDGKNGGAFLDAYAMDGVPNYRTIAPNNVAVLRLASSLNIKADSPVQAAVIPSLNGVYADWAKLHAETDGWKFRACGVGVIDNIGTQSNGVMCADLVIAPVAQCKENAADKDPTLPGTDLCLLWPDRDNNVCMGDYGGPVYAYKNDANDKLEKQEVFCVTVGSPNVRKNAPCLDGHIVYCEFIPGPLAAKGTFAWIDAITKL